MGQAFRADEETVSDGFRRAGWMSWRRFTVGFAALAAGVGLCLHLAEQPASGAKPTARTRTPLTAQAVAQRRLGYAPSSAAPPVETAQVLRDDGGPIAEILLHYSHTSELEIGPVYRDLFDRLDPETRIVVCCPNQEAQQAFVSGWGQAAVQGGRAVHVVNVNRPVSIWARDRRIARQERQRPAASFVPSPHHTYDAEKQNDLLLQTMLWTTGLVPRVALSSFHLEGGNCVANRRHVFIGRNVVADNPQRFPDASLVREELERMFGREPLLVCDRQGATPWCHTDMYITPVDDRTIFVGSPAEGLAVLERSAAAGDPQPAILQTLKFNLATQGTHIQAQFDDIAEQLTEAGYDVRRTPSLINVEQDWMLTYNNVLMERRHGDRVVFLPSYGIPALDEAASAIYREHGFEVRPIDVSQVFKLGGTVRCLVNVTQRREVDLPPSSRANPNGSLKIYEVGTPAVATAVPRRRPQHPPAPRPSRELREQNDDYRARDDDSRARDFEYPRERETRTSDDRLPRSLSDTFGEEAIDPEAAPRGYYVPRE